LRAPEPLNLKRSESEWRRAQSLIPGGVLGIRRPYNFVEGEYPIFIDHGTGGRITDVDGNEFIDYLCAYGPIILGYRETEVDEAVISQIRDRGFCFSLTQIWQNQLAETMRELIPCSEMSLFTKTGSDATTVATRLARSFTGREKIIRCGYHGWHDWCVEVKGGIPEKLYEDVFEFSYNDPDELESLLKQHGDTTACIIMTPYGHPLAAPMEDPKPGFLERVRHLADRHGVLLVFDEVRTGFRLSLGGAQKKYGVTPDLSVFGKAMANGYAIGAVTGRADIMKRGEDEVFVSSTFFPNSLSYIAALKTIEILQRDQVLESIETKGRDYMTRVQALIDQSGLGVRLSGLPQMNFITFEKDPEKRYKKRRTDFFTYLIRSGVFLQPYHHAYICHRHTASDIDLTVAAIGDALEWIKDQNQR
jgi:glutamate-1-semialdehyde aminotransferase